MSDNARFPGATWDRAEPRGVGFDPERLRAAQRWMAQRVGDSRYRVAIVRAGQLVAEWNHNVGAKEELNLASAAKSVFSSILGIAIDEGVIPSADAKLVDLYPAALDVPQGTGPKPGRFARPKDRAITLRQLISNTSGYMKPGEEPGQVFHYQTYGMNVLTHAIATAYGLYDPADPTGSPGFKVLVNRCLRDPIGAQWGYRQANFDLPAAARIHIFGYYDGIKSTALDMARLGWCWRHGGRWSDQQLIPADWLAEATHVAPMIRANCPRNEWCYGYGFWTNEYGQLWPHLPTDSFAASGAGRQHIWVCPSEDLVVVQSPGLYEKQHDNDDGLLRLIVDAL